MVAIIGLSSTSVTTVSMFQYGISVYLQQYGSSDADQKYANSKLSAMFFACSLSNLFLSLIAGYCIDRLSGMWRFIFAIACTAIFTLCCFYKASKDLVGVQLETGDSGSWLQDFGFAGSVLMASISFFWNLLFFTKSIVKSSLSYATLKGAQSGLTSLCMIMCF